MSEWQESTIGRIPAHWEFKKVSDCGLQIGDGNYSSKYPRQKELLSEGIPFISSTDLTNGKVIRDNLRYISPKQHSTLLKGHIKKDDVLIVVRGNGVGDVALVDERFDGANINAQLAFFRGNDNYSGPFLYYLLLSYNQRGVTTRYVSGSAQPQITVRALNQIFLILPPLSEQIAITAVLSSLDDKIDLLHRQNKTLEALAQTLFRHWFIDGAEDGWEERPVNHFGDVICGKTPSKKVLDYFNGKIPFIKIPDMHGQIFIFDTSDSLTELGKNSQLNKTIPPRSISVSCIATVGLVTMNAFESQTNQQINTIVPHKDYFRYFLYLMMLSLEDELVLMASGGTATLNLNTGNFSRMDIISPPKAILKDFHNLVEPLFEKIFRNQSQIRTLEKLRDTLLPKLMSGEVRVRHQN
ncbi:MAG: restriction endonuclease subunit S [Anaerolineae bacterium]|nr:restriction endonuclease subunit S [Anaerolineae bacterium]